MDVEFPTTFRRKEEQQQPPVISGNLPYFSGHFRVKRIPTPSWSVDDAQRNFADVLFSDPDARTAVVQTMCLSSSVAQFQP